MCPTAQKVPPRILLRCPSILTLERALVVLQLVRALCVDGVSLSFPRKTSEPLGEARWPKTAEASSNALPQGCDTEILRTRHQFWTLCRTESHDCMSFTSSKDTSNVESRAVVLRQVRLRRAKAVSQRTATGSISCERHPLPKPPFSQILLGV